MSQVSKYVVEKDVFVRIRDLFLKAVSGLATRKKTADFFEGFLTPTEQVMLSKRLAIGIMLAKDYQYRDIAKVLKVSMGTIGSVGVSYKNYPKFKKIVDELIREENAEDFLLKIGEAIASVGTYGGKGSGTWRSIRDSLSEKRKRKVF